jgi:hypothetical protein
MESRKLEGETMRKAIFTILAVMAVAVGVTALGSAHAKYVHLHPPSDGNDCSGSS